MPNATERSPRAHDHEDSHGVFVPRWMLAATSPHTAAAILLAQVTWWLQPDRRGRDKFPVVLRDGRRWVAIPDSAWLDDIGLTADQARKARAKLVDLGLVEAERRSFKGAPTAHYRLLEQLVLSGENREAFGPGAKCHSGQGPQPAGQSPNGAPARASSYTRTQETKDPHPSPDGEDAVRVLLDAWWQERRDAGNPVGQKYVACLGVVRAMAKQGVQLNRIAYALRHSPVVSAAALELAIQNQLQALGQRPGQRRPTKNEALVARNPGLADVLREHLFTDPTMKEITG